MRKAAAGWSASEAEIVDDQYVRRQRNVNADAERTIEQIAWLMDRSIPIGGVRIGLDPILGLLPGVGDVFSGLISTLIIVQAHRAGVPRATLLRMMTNVAIDSAVGAIPFVGDLFDFAWKSNWRNFELYRDSVRDQHRTSSDWGFLTLVVIGLLIIITIPLVLAFWIVRAIF